MKKFLEKNKKKLLIIFIIIIVAITLFIIFRNRNKTKIYEVNMSNYSLQYDNTWKIDKEEEMEIKLLHKKSNSELNIKINEIENEYQYKTLDELSDMLLYNIQEQNKNYKLIYRENSKITKNNLDAYKILFESDNSQASVYYYKQGNKLVVFTYEAKFEYFDILLDSVNSIIYSFNINEQKFDVITDIDLNMTNIDYTEQEDISSLLNDTQNDEIASSNYLVNYSIPDNFKSIDYDTRHGRYKFENLPTGTNLELDTAILNLNLYEYLDREDTSSIYKHYNLNSYNKSKEALNKFGNEPLSYIYKNSYLYNNEIIENIEIIFELNKNHIFIVKMSSRGIGIPEELVKMIKVNNIENIASNIKIEKENGFLIGKLKRFVDYTYEKTEEITLKIPVDYQEIDIQNSLLENNLYEERNYVCNYNEEKDIYEYEVSYETTNFDINTKIKSLNREIEYYKEYGEYKEFSKSKDVVVNGKQFEVYDGLYTRHK